MGIRDAVSFSDRGLYDFFGDVSVNLDRMGSVWKTHRAIPEVFERRSSSSDLGF